MSKYKETYGYPKADISVFRDVVHILPPKDDGPTNDEGVPTWSHDYALKFRTILAYPEVIEKKHIQEDVENFVADMRAWYDEEGIEGRMSRQQFSTFLKAQEDRSQDLMQRVAEHFAHDLQEVPCNRCGAMVWVDEWRGSYAKNQCAGCSKKCYDCGAENSYECIRSSRRTRVPNIYKCTECGHRKEGIITG